MKKIKIGLYNLLDKGIGKTALRALSNLVTVGNLRKNTLKSGKKPKKFLICITIDTESGYVKANNERVWQKDAPEAYVGYYKGIQNWRVLLNKYDAKATFFLSTNCFSAKNKELSKIKSQLKLLLKEKHEIGLHMHPDSDLALQIQLKERFQYTSARFYDYNKINNHHINF